MTEGDIGTVLLIEQASFAIPWKSEHFLHEISAPYSLPFIAECKGEVAGYLCLTVLFEDAQILDIAVDPKLRGSGIARSLMKLAIELATERGAEVLSLEVRCTNTVAIRLYERFGFMKTGTRLKYYEGRDDAVLMEINLKEMT
jgi:ribosomal-protein-alanine N-acetyltransferase